MAASIRFVHVSKQYPGGGAGAAGRPEREQRCALDAASFDIAAGEFVFLTGHSGAGKSTVFRLLAAIERPTGGTVLVGDQNVGGMPAATIPFFRRNLGLVLQDQRLVADRTVFDNVLLPLAVAGVAPRDAARRVRAALDKVGLAGHEKSNPVALSGGEQQRVLVARAVVNRPALLLADEPTASLDADTADVILSLFRSFHVVGTTVVLATHDTALIARHPARRITLAHGRVVA